MGNLTGNRVFEVKLEGETREKRTAFMEMEIGGGTLLRKEGYLITRSRGSVEAMLSKRGPKLVQVLIQQQKHYGVNELFS